MVVGTLEHDCAYEHGLPTCATAACGYWVASYGSIWPLWVFAHSFVDLAIDSAVSCSPLRGCFG